MIKNNVKKMVASVGIMAFMALPAFAATTTGISVTAGSKASTMTVACVGGAVNAREQSIDSALTTYTTAITAAYNARATALASAYGMSTSAGVRASLKTAWSAFSVSMKSTRNSWSSARTTAWAKFRTDAKACKAPATISDSTNASMEASGQ
jgi:hypothetical protein